MFKSLVKFFKAEGLLAQANDQIVGMLKEDLSLFNDSVKLLWTEEGVTIEEIKERDRQINKDVREVRKKVLTHLAFSGASGMETALVLLFIVVYIERIGDHTKDIGSLATDYPGEFEAGSFKDGVKKLEQRLRERLELLIDIFETGDEVREKASSLTKSHPEVNEMYRTMIYRLLTDDGDKGLNCPQTAKLALYLRYLRRVEGHIFNIASTEVNPFHRIGFKKKKLSD